MTMIKGKIETEREVVPKRVVYGNPSTYKITDTSWVHSSSGVVVDMKAMRTFAQSLRSLPRKQIK
jgi:hypothetical protein